MKNKTIIAIMAVIIVALVAVVIFLLVRENDTNNPGDSVVSDAEKFAGEYQLIDEDNVFTYAEITEIIDILENGTGIIYLGFPECMWCDQYVVYLNEVVQERDIAQIHYYNIREDRSSNTDDYLQIVELLAQYLHDDEEGNPRIYVPAVIFVRDGEIVGFDDETAYDTGGFATPSEYWSDTAISELKERLNSYIDNYSVCIDCNS